MLKRIFSSLIILGFTHSAFAQGHTTNRMAPTQQDQFAQYLMRGMSFGMELTSINADVRISMSSDSDSFTATGSTDKTSTALGVSLNYSSVPRGGLGWSAGGALTQLPGSTGGDKSVSSWGVTTFLRPEANLVGSLSNGLIFGGGGHLSMISGKTAEENVVPLGGGLQVLLGYVPSKNIAMDLGYIISIHKLSSTFKNDIEKNGSILLNDSDSYVAFKQLRARLTYMF